MNCRAVRYRPSELETPVDGEVMRLRSALTELIHRASDPDVYQNVLGARVMLEGAVADAKKILEER